MVKKGSEESFGIETKNRLGYALVILQGAFTVKNLFHVRSELQEILEDSIENIVFDLGNCAEIDSSGLGILSNLYKKLNRQGGELGVFNMSPDIQKIMSETGLDNILIFFENLEGADAHFDL